MKKIISKQLLWLPSRVELRILFLLWSSVFERVMPCRVIDGILFYQSFWVIYVSLVFVSSFDIFIIRNQLWSDDTRLNSWCYWICIARFKEMKLFSNTCLFIPTSIKNYLKLTEEKIKSTTTISNPSIILLISRFG